METTRDFLRQMREATELLQTSGPLAATAAIQRALQGASSVGGIRGPRAQQAVRRSADWSSAMPQADLNWKDARAGQLLLDAGAGTEVDRTSQGSFLSASRTSAAGTRNYKVYVPSSYQGQSLPLIVMLHGCKQNPDDFAAGTGMNAIAERSNYLVVYPAQARAANGSNCWNWFKSEDQQRDRGEPSIIADITRDVIREYHVDPARVYVAGLSAGGAMAAIMGAAYPDLYAAIGIHSGLPVGAAHDLPSAFAAMKQGAATKGRHSARKLPIPVIVFHGDCDRTVHPRNGEQTLAQCIEPDAHDVTVEEGQVSGGHSYTRSVLRDRGGKVIAERWCVHGAGHAWSGGSRNGSYTDPRGPDASQEMLRFFYAHSRNG